MGRQQQELVGQPGHPLGLLPDRTQRRRLRLSIGRHELGQLDLGGDDRQRRPQLVAGLGNEPALALQGLPDRPERQPGDRVTGTARGEHGHGQPDDLGDQQRSERLVALVERRTDHHEVGLRRGWSPEWPAAAGPRRARSSPGRSQVTGPSQRRLEPTRIQQGDPGEGAGGHHGAVGAQDLGHLLVGLEGGPAGWGQIRADLVDKPGHLPGRACRLRSSARSSSADTRQNTKAPIPSTTGASTAAKAAATRQRIGSRLRSSTPLPAGSRGRVR